MKRIIYALLFSLLLVSCGSSKQITTTTVIEYRDTTIVGDSIPCPDVILSQTTTSVQTEKPKWQVKKEIRLENKKHKRETRANKQVAKAEIKAEAKVDVVEAKQETKQKESDNKAEVKINKQDNKAEVKIKKKNSWWRILLIGIMIGFFLRFILRFVLGFFGVKFK